MTPREERLMRIRRMAAIAAALILTISATCWSGEEKDPIDERQEDCIAKNSTTRGMVKCTIQAREAWDKELNVVYNKLMNRLEPKGKEDLKQSQRQWIKYRDDQFQFIGTFYDGFEGTMWIPMRAGALTEVVKERTIRLRSYLNLLELK
jgi:uncharacterized protein YecT (DUF1311 family)